MPPRGECCDDSCSSIATFVDSCSGEIVFIQKSKTSVVSLASLAKFWIEQEGLSPLMETLVKKNVELPAAGASSGILVARRHGPGLASAALVDSHCVSVQFNLTNGQLRCLTCVY